MRLLVYGQGRSSYGGATSALKTMNVLNNLQSSFPLDNQGENSLPPLHDLYGRLCDVELLQHAYTAITKDSANLSPVACALQVVEVEGQEEFFRRLSKDLQIRTYHLASPIRHGPAENVSGQSSEMTALRDRVVEVALKLVLDAHFVADGPCAPEPESVMRWMADAIERGLKRAYAVTVEECAPGRPELLFTRLRQAIADPDLVALLEQFLSNQSRSSRPGLLGPVVANIALQGIDRVLEQVKAIMRHGAFVHAACARFGNDVIILWDPDPQYDWLLPAVKKRLSEALAEVNYEVDPSKTQVVDLARGEKLRFLGFELRLVKDKDGTRRVRYRCVDRPARQSVKVGWAGRPGLIDWLRRLRLRGFFLHPWNLVRRCWKWLGLQRRGHIIQQTYRNTGSIQAGWRHLPILLIPLCVLFLGLFSPITWLCAAAMVIGNWRRIPVVAGFARRHWLDVIGVAAGMGLLVCLFLLGSDIYGHLPREVPAPHMPAGFYLGEYRPSWDAEPARYGLYLPPHFQKEKGPFPLIVFLHGYGERGLDQFLAAGVPQSIVLRFGESMPNGRFEFAAFFPTDPEGMWALRPDAMEGVIKALDHVVKRHRIDPRRVYLTGHSSGGDGVWGLAEAHPEKWAAVAPVACFSDPDIGKVRHLPVWIFHGTKDTNAPVQRERALVQKLKAAKADVRYTEIPDKAHVIWREVYDRKELYDWFAQKTRP